MDELIDELKHLKWQIDKWRVSQIRWRWNYYGHKYRDINYTYRYRNLQTILIDIFFFMYDVIIIGGGVSGVSCGLVLGSAKEKPFANDKKIGIITHQKASSLQNAIFNNAYGIAPGKLGSELLIESLEHLQKLYPHVEQLGNEKVLERNIV